MLTPQEVSSHAFPKAVMGGYNMGSVDEFLDELTDDYTALYKENAALKAKMKVLVEKVEDYRATEDSMRATLLTAQKMADSIVKEAEQKRDEMLARTETEARIKVDQLQNEALTAQERLKTGQRELYSFIAATRAICAKELEFLDRLPELPAEKTQQAEAADPRCKVAEIEQTVMASFDGKTEEPAQPEPELETEPETKAEPEPDPDAAEEVQKPEYPEGNPFDQDMRDDDPTRRIDLSELRFGRNYAEGRNMNR